MRQIGVKGMQRGGGKDQWLMPGGAKGQSEVVAEGPDCRKLNHKAAELRGFSCCE